MKSFASSHSLSAFKNGYDGNIKHDAAQNMFED